MKRKIMQFIIVYAALTSFENRRLLVNDRMLSIKDTMKPV